VIEPPVHRRALIASSALFALADLAPPLLTAAQAMTDLPKQQRLGVYKGAGCDGRAAMIGFNAWLGRRPEWIVDFLAQETWGSFGKSAIWVAGCWRGADYRLALAVPMLTQDHRNTLALGAAGAYDAHYQRLAHTLVSVGRADAVIRLGWEFNGDWSTWCPAKDPSSFIRYWRRIVGVMRAAPGAKLRFDWNPALGHAAIAPDQVYPGDDVVDIIGLDVYNQSWTVPRPSSQKRWQEIREQPFGLDWHRDFAQARGKPRSFPEWGTGRRPDGSGGGDDPLFVTEMAAWLSAPDVVYHGYWDYPASDYYAQLSTGQFPHAAAAFREHFGQTVQHP
jgi:hypothetical protein